MNPNFVQRLWQKSAVSGGISLVAYLAASGSTVCLDWRPANLREFLGVWALHDPAFLVSLLFAGLTLGFALTAGLYAVRELIGRHFETVPDAR